MGPGARRDDLEKKNICWSLSGFEPLDCPYRSHYIDYTIPAPRLKQVQANITKQMIPTTCVKVPSSRK